MDIAGLLGWFAVNGGTVLSAVLQIVGAFALIATLTPNKVDNKIAQVLMDLINFIGANVNKAKNNP